MIERSWTLLLALALMGCGDKDTSLSDGGDGSTGSDSCDTDNEDCAPGGCGGEGGDMLPGSDCQACHSPGNFEEDEDDAYWSVSGTVFQDLYGGGGADGVIVRVTDSEGSTIELDSRSSGNFYSRDQLVPPLTAELERDGDILSMSTEIETGACNSCHRCDGSPGGKLFAP